MPVVYSKYTANDLVGLINKFAQYFKLPGQRLNRELHLPSMQFAGPGTMLDLRLNSNGCPKYWRQPRDRVDEAAYRHDLEYAAHSDTANRNVKDEIMVQELDAIQIPTLRE